MIIGEKMFLAIVIGAPIWISAIIDVEGAFLRGRFANGEELYIEVPDRFHEWYDGDVVLRMNVPLYGTKQAAYCFFNMFPS